MKDNQSSKLKMYINLQGVANRYNEAWSGVVAYMQAYAIFTGNVLNINQLNEQLQISSRGATVDKGQLKETMAEKAAVLVGALKAFSSVTANAALAEDIDFSYTSIAKSKDTDADDICRHIFSEANKRQSALVDFGITQADLDGLLEAINQYTITIGRPKATIIQVKSLNEQMHNLFKANDKIVSEQLDNLMFRFKASHPAFYNEYFSSRMIGSQGSRSVKETREVAVK